MNSSSHPIIRCARHPRPPARCLAIAAGPVFGKRRTQIIALVLLALLWGIRAVVAAPPSASWPKTFSDEFSGSSIDSSKWSHGSLPWGGRHHNNEYASYIMPEDSYVNGGSLWLRSRKASGGEFGGYPYSQGFVHSQGKLNYTYGYVEIRSRYPTGKGVWPAFWTLSWEAGWPPEFDIAEYFGSDDRMHMGLAYSSGGTQWNSSNFSGEGVAGWHTWALEWGPGYAIWYKDGVLKKAIYASYVPSVPMYIILNSGMRYDADGSTPFPNYYEVDYFRKYNPPSAVVNDNTTGTGVNQFNYVGNWGYSSQANAFFNDNHYSSTTDAYVEIQFTGNRIDLHGAKAPNHGIAAVSIDGGPETFVDYYASSRRERAFVWSAAGLPAGTKTLKVRVTGTRNGASTGNSVAIDRVTVWNASGFLNGPLIGTAGSYNDEGNTKEKAVDGDLGSFFDAPIPDGAWVGRDLGTAKRITKVRYAPRSSYANRMNGGIFQGANLPDFSDAVDLFTITSAPFEETVTDQNIANTNGFRYVRYLSPAGGQGNVAVVEFYGSEPEAYNGTWIADADGNWSDPTKWSGGTVANGADSTANFSTINISANRTVTLDTARSITTLRFGDTSGAQNWTLDASEGSVLTLDAGSGTSPLMAVNQNTATILAPLDGVSGFTKNGAGTLVLSGENALSGTVYLDRWADGSALNDGAVRVTSSAAMANVTQLSIRNTSVTTGGGRLELDGSAHEVSVGAPLLTTMRNNNSLGNLRNVAGTNTFAGNVQVLTGGTNVVFQSDAGTLVLAGDVQYVGTLTSARSYSFVGADDILVTGSLLHASNSATINLWKSGAGTTTLAGSNSFTGTTFITGNGAVRAVSPFALSSGPVSIGSGPADTCRLELAGDVTFTNAINFAVRANNPAPHLVNVSGTNTLNPAANLSFGSGGNQVTLRSDAGRLVLAKGVTVTGGSGKFLALDGAGDGEIQGALTQAAPANTLSALVKSGNGAWTLNQISTTSGAITNLDGTLVLNGATSVTNVSVAGGTLAGNGIITGPVKIETGGVLSPGVSIGQLIISNALTLAGTTVLELNKAAQTNDSVVGLSSVTYGGTLVVTNLAGTLAAGDSFQLFNATNYAGSFAEIILPPLSPGLTWDTNALSSGALSVVASVPTTPVPLTSLFTGSQITLSWPASHMGWRLETNATDLSDANAWFNYPGAAETNELFLQVDPTQPHVFYRLAYP